MSVATAEPIAHRLVGQESTWTTVVWDDPVNLMDYVTMVFMRYFGYPRERATQLMIQVHNPVSYTHLTLPTIYSV